VTPSGLRRLFAATAGAIGTVAGLLRLERVAISCGGECSSFCFATLRMTVATLMRSVLQGASLSPGMTAGVAVSRHVHMRSL
jgi:hypothetical protein